MIAYKKSITEPRLLSKNHKGLRELYLNRKRNVNNGEVVIGIE